MSYRLSIFVSREPVMDKPATTSVITMDEKKRLYALFMHLVTHGVNFKHVAEATGINYKSLINKFTSLTSEVTGTGTSNRNRFTKADYDAVMEWWGGYREEMYTFAIGG
jgi:hypothetical protein